MEERPAETNSNVDNSASPSVAQLAGRFREQAAAAAKEMPASRPARRKPPCSLPLFPPKVELGQNGEEKPPPNASHLPKVKVKSSPLIEKLQANLAFDPAALLPGASPKSPGLKAVVSPFNSPPSTPSSPGVRSQASEPEEVPISFDQPPEGSHLPCYNKVRTRGSIKRRPPSRRFRRSQSDFGELGDGRAAEPSQENGAQEEAGSEPEAPGSPPPGEGAVGSEGRTALGSQEKLPLKRTSSRTDKQEEKARAPEEKVRAPEEKARAPEEKVRAPEEKAQAPEEAPQLPEKAAQVAREEAGEPAPAPSTEAENRCGSPTEDRPAAEQRAASAGVKEERAGGEAEPAQQSHGAERPEEGAVGQESPQSPPGGVEGGLTPEEGDTKGKQQEGTVLEPGCHPRTGSEVPETKDDASTQDTRM